MSNRSSDASNILGAIGVAIVVLIAMVPKPVWIALGIVAAVAVVTWIVYAIVKEVENSRIEAEKRAQADRVAKAAAAKRELEERELKEKQRRIDTLGKQNASLVEDALKAVSYTHLTLATKA